MTPFEGRRRLPERVVRAAFTRPRATLAWWALVLLVAGLGARGLRIDTSTDSILDRSDPAYAYHRHSQSLFGGEEMLVVAIAGEQPWDQHALSEVVRLSALFEGIDSVRRVDSLDTVPLIRVANDGELELDPPLAGGVPETPAARRRLAAEVMAASPA